MEKIDFKQTDKAWYLPSAKAAGLVHLPALPFLMVDGRGHPGQSEEFQPSIEALYSSAYTLKFMFRNGPKPAGWADFVVPPLESLWWMQDGGDFDVDRPADWRWTLMIRVPDFITSAMLEDARNQLRRKKTLPALDGLRLETFEEGKAVQILHIGPYDQEGPAVAQLHAFAAANGLTFCGKHHEIYLSSPGRTAPEKLKTVVRYPVK